MIGKAIAAATFAAALAIASIPSDAFAQRGGGGGFRGGGGGGFHGGGGGGFRGGFGGGGFRGGFGGGGFRGGFGGGPRFVGGGPRFHRGFYPRRFYGYRRPFIGFGAPLYIGYPRCFRLVRILTPYGWAFRRVWVCGPRYRSVYY
jgi:hypothetical protein